MILPRLAVILAGCAVGAAATAAMFQPASATSPLRPLSEADQSSTHESGCGCGFSVGNRTLVQVVGNELMIRTAAGRQACRISDAQFSALTNGNATATCGGLRLGLRPTGRTIASPQTDSATTPSALTVRQGGSTRVLRGQWGCAC